MIDNIYIYKYIYIFMLPWWRTNRAKLGSNISILFIFSKISIFSRQPDIDKNTKEKATGVKHKTSLV